MLDHAQPSREMESSNKGIQTTCKILKESNIPFQRNCIWKMVPIDQTRECLVITGDQIFLRYSFCARRFRYIKINILETIQKFLLRKVVLITINQSVLIWSMVMSCATRHLLILFMEDQNQSNTMHVQLLREMSGDV